MEFIDFSTGALNDVIRGIVDVNVVVDLKGG